MTIGDALKQGVRQLQQTAVIDPISSARLLLQGVVNKNWTELFRDANHAISNKQFNSYQQLLYRRAKHEPVAYITGETYFCGLKLKVTPDVLIPRPETEELVKFVVDFTQQAAHDQQPVSKIIDLGTGSGDIAIALATKLSAGPDTTPQIYAIDVSNAAIEVARANAVANGLQEVITFICADLLPEDSDELLEDQPVIVANLPYVPHQRIAKLDADVKDFEPSLALDGGVDGLDLYRQLFKKLVDSRKVPRAIFCEIDETQGELMHKLMRSFWPKAKMQVWKDLRGLDRYMLMTEHVGS